MVHDADIESMLATGSWKNTSLRPRTRDTRHLYTSPTATTSYTYNDTVVPRSSGFFPYGTRPIFRRPPPSPTVEDEVESLAKEHGSVFSVHTSEEPQQRGEVDQLPIIQGVHEHNPERRFVIVPISEEYGYKKEDDHESEEDESPGTDKRPGQWATGSDAAGGTERRHVSPGRKPVYKANTRRKFVVRAPEEEETKHKSERETSRDEDRETTRPTGERRWSRREDLPALVTDISSTGRAAGTSDAAPRTESASAHGLSPDDYFSPLVRSRNLPSEPRLSPDVITHSTKGRDRAYWDYSGASNPEELQRRRSRTDKDPQGGRSLPSQQRHGQREAPSPMTTPPIFKRHSTLDVPDNRHRLRVGSFDKGPQYLPDATRPRLSRESSLATSPTTIRDPRASFKDRLGSQHSDDDRYSSEEEVRRRTDIHRRRKSTIHDDRVRLGTPADLLHDDRSKTTSPLASPRTTPQARIRLGSREPSPSHRSTTFPVLKEPKRFDSRYPTDELSPGRPLSGASTARSSISSVAPLITPLTTTATATDTDRRKPDIPTPTGVRPAIHSRSGSRSSSMSTPSAISPVQSWKPPKFDPVLDDTAPSENPVTSYRKYSEDAGKRDLPDLPVCPRTAAEAGHFDWLTLPGIDNFNICPSCYQHAFENTKFKQFLRPAPFRQDRPIKCDFGTSQYYHIAWLLTHKNKITDLHLFRGVANVVANSHACSGQYEDYRLWYTIKDPASHRPIPNFTVCQTCARIMEVLLPNLSGVFVPMDSPAEPAKGICDMHQHEGRARRRFVCYFDAMETASDRAMTDQSPPDLRFLADSIRAQSEIPKCAKSRPRRDETWYVMRSVPELTVCHDCFHEVVAPVLDRDADAAADDADDRNEDANATTTGESSSASAVPGDFYHRPQRLRVAACMLYSPRMRDVFHKAAAITPGTSRRDGSGGGGGIEYLASKVRERVEKEREIHAKLAELATSARGAEWVDGQVQMLQAEWARWE